MTSILLLIIILIVVVVVVFICHLVVNIDGNGVLQSLFSALVKHSRRPYLKYSAVLGEGVN